MDHYISMFIDNELTLNEKKQFIFSIHHDATYYTTAESLITQEQELQKVLQTDEPELSLVQVRKKVSHKRVRWASAAVLALALAFGSGLSLTLIQPDGLDSPIAIIEPETMHRFVIYHEGTEQVEIVGSFTGWQKVPLSQTGRGGYWEVTLPLSDGEHRYSFLIDGKRSLPDPTVASSEADDFGSVNSILLVQGNNATS